MFLTFIYTQQHGIQFLLFGGQVVFGDSSAPSHHPRLHYTCVYISFIYTTTHTYNNTFYFDFQERECLSFPESWLLQFSPQMLDI